MEILYILKNLKILWFDEKTIKLKVQIEKKMKEIISVLKSKINYNYKLKSDNKYT